MTGSCRSLPEKSAIRVSKGKPLLEEVCDFFEEKSRCEVVFRVCEDEGEEAGGSSLLDESACVRSAAPFCGEDVVLV